MPIFDQGYQHWDGARVQRWERWWAVTRRGLRSQGKHWFLRLLFLGAHMGALFLALILASVLAVWGLIEQGSSYVSSFTGVFGNLLGLPASLVESGPKAFRGPVWSVAFEIYLGLQSACWMLLVLLVGPGLISQDLRSNALPLYLSRPISRFEYFLGKFGVIAVRLSLVTWIPALVAYIVGLGFSADIMVIRDTWRVLVGAMVYGVIVIISAGMIILAFSALTRNSRFVGFLWIVFWVMSQVLAVFLTVAVKERWCPLVDYRENLRIVRESLLDTKAAWKKVDELLAQEEKKTTLFGFKIPNLNAPNRNNESRSPFSRDRREGGGRGGPFSRGRPRPGDPFSQVEQAPWTWAMGVLAGLTGASALVLSQRIRTLDRLK